MDVTKQLSRIEQLIEEYEDAYDPEEKMDLKQTIQSEIKKIRQHMPSLPADLQASVKASIDDYEEILTY